MRKSLAITITSLFASLYAVITIIQTNLVGPLTYGPIQVRLSDCLLPMPMVFGIPAAIGLFLGCMVANAYYMLSPLDIVFGSLANLIAGILSAKYSKGKVLLAALYPVLIVTFIVGSYLPILTPGGLIAPDEPIWAVYASFYLTIGAGEAITCFIFGVPLLKAVKNAFGDRFISR